MRGLQGFLVFSKCGQVPLAQLARQTSLVTSNQTTLVLYCFLSKCSLLGLLSDAVFSPPLARPSQGE